jgi:hypothetical protein
MTARVGEAHQIPIAPKQKARREAGLWVEALNRRRPITNAIS